MIIVSFRMGLIRFNPGTFPSFQLGFAHFALLQNPNEVLPQSISGFWPRNRYTNLNSDYLFLFCWRLQIISLKLLNTIFERWKENSQALTPFGIWLLIRIYLQSSPAIIQFYPRFSYLPIQNGNKIRKNYSFLEDQ